MEKVIDTNPAAVDDSYAGLKNYIENLQNVGFKELVPAKDYVLIDAPELKFESESGIYVGETLAKERAQKVDLWRKVIRSNSKEYSAGDMVMLQPNAPSSPVKWKDTVYSLIPENFIICKGVK